MLVISALSGCGEQGTDGKAPTPVRVHRIAQDAGYDEIRYSAIIEPFERVNLAFKVGGYIEEILQQPGPDGRLRDVEKGDRIVKGTVMARVRDTDFIEKVNQARSQYNEAKAAMIRAQQDYSRARDLYEEDTISKGEYDAARARMEASKAKTRGAKALLEGSQIILRDTALKAPIDALVLERNIEVGTLVNPGTVGFVLADVDSVKVVFGVPDTTVHNLRLGDRLEVTTEATRNVPFDGQISAIAPSADPLSRVFEVELTIPNPDDVLKTGMIATVQLSAQHTGVDQSSIAVTIPLSAIVRPPGQSEGYAVFVVQDENGTIVARTRTVLLGEMQRNNIAVVSGLTQGERVIVIGATLVIDGDPVQIIP